MSDIDEAESVANFSSNHPSSIHQNPDRRLDAPRNCSQNDNYPKI